MKKQEKKSILFLSHYFWPEEMATSVLLSGIAFKLKQAEYMVDGLAGQPAYLLVKKLLPKMVEHNGVCIKRVWSTKLNKNTTIGRIINTASFTLSALFNLLFRRQADVLITVTNPPLLLWVACVNNLIRGTKYVLIIHDVYPDVAVKLGKIKEGSMIEKLWKKLNRFSYARASKIVVLGSCMKAVIDAEISKHHQEKIEVIENWADGNFIKPYPRENHPQLIEWGLNDKFVVQYSGNLGLFHDFETMLGAAKILKDNKKVHFLFIGEGGQLPNIQHVIDKHKLKNITLKPFQPFEKLPLTLTACDLALISLKEEITGLCVPSKLYGVLASGKAVISIADKKTETSREIIKNDCGENVYPGDCKQLAEKILMYSADTNLLRCKSLNARKAFDDKYTLNVISEKYRNLIERV